MVTLVAWNLNHWQRAHDAGAVAATWAYLRDDLGADVALVSEAVAPVDWAPTGVVGKLGTDGGDKWGAGIVNVTGVVQLIEVTELSAPDGKSTLPFSWTRPGTAAAATFMHQDTPVLLACVYGKFVGGRSYATMLHHAADLAPVLETHPRVLVAGDMNLTTQWIGSDASYNRVEQTALDAFTCWGLQDLIATSGLPAAPDCGCEREQCQHVQTHWHSRSSRPWQIDHAFASPGLGVTSVRVDAAAVVDHGLSDHAPLVIELG